MELIDTVDGSVDVIVDPGAFSDLAGNTNVNPISLSVTIDKNQPIMLAPTHINAVKPDNQFGAMVDIDGTVAVVGTEHNDGEGTGEALVYHLIDETWVFQQRLVPDEAMYRDYVGASVAVSGDTIVLGASGDDSIGDG